MKPILYTDEMIQEYTEKGYWKDVTYADLYQQCAEKYPDKEALVDSQKRLTWSEANLQANRIALKFLELGLEKDDIIICHMPNMVELNLVLAAFNKAGLIYAGAVRTLRDEEISFISKCTEAKGYLSVREFRGFDYWDMIQKIRPDVPSLTNIFIVGGNLPEGAISIEEVIQEPLEDRHSIEDLRKRQVKYHEVESISFTSGTTGFPKVVEWPQTARTFAAESHMKKIKMTSDDVIGAIAPVFGAGRSGYFFTPFNGAKTVHMEHFDAKRALELIEKEKITLPAVVPAQLAMMLNHPDFDKHDLTSVRVIYSGGAPMPMELARELEKKFGAVLINHYGGMDAGGLSACSVDDPPEVRFFMVGAPHPGNEIRILDKEGKEVPTGEVGTINFRGPGAAGGYYKDRKMTEEKWGSGWFNMGDLGKLDDKGNLMIVGREKDVIIRGGQNIYSAEVENAIQTHPKIVSAALVAMPDKVMGERACVFISLANKSDEITLEGLGSFLKGKGLSAYKCPERIEFIDKMPLVSDAKIDKKVLKSMLDKKLADETG